MKNSHRALAVAVAALWGINFVVIDLALRDLPPLLLTSARFAVTAIPLVFLLPRPTAKARYVLGYGFVLGVLKFGMLFTAMAAGMPAGLASLVLQTQALVSVALAAALLRERPGAARVAGVCVGLAGIAMLAAGRGGTATAAGFALTIGAAVAWAFANVISRASGERRPLSLLVWASLVPPLPLLLLAVGLDGPDQVWQTVSQISLVGVLAVLFIAYASTLLGFGAWNHLIGVYSVSRVAPFSLLVPVVGVAAAWLFLGQRLTWGQLAAAALVLLGLGLVVRRDRPPRPSTGDDRANGPASDAATRPAPTESEGAEPAGTGSASAEIEKVGAA